MSVDASFPPTHMVAPADKRYVNKYYYNASTHVWEVVVAASRSANGSINYWTVQEVDQDDGRPCGPVREHTLDLWADRFADRPFAVTRSGRPYNLETELDWFSRMIGPHTPAELNTLYSAYTERRKTCNSFEALVRIGVRSID